jgi:signal transduction histidine kinase
VGELPATQLGTLLALMTVTVVLLARRPRHAVTWVLVAYTATALSFVVDPEGSLFLVWASMWAPLLLAFPDGVRTSPLRQVGFWYVVVGLIVVGSLSFVPGGPPALKPPLGMILGLTLASCLPIAAAALVALVRIWARSDGLRRARVTVVLGGTGLLGVTIIVTGVDTVAEAPFAPAWLRNLGFGGVLDASVPLAFLMLPIAVGISMLLEPPSRRMRWVDWVWPWLLTVAAGLVIGGTVWELADASGTPSSSGSAGEWVAGMAGAVSAVVAAGVLFAVRPGRSRVPTTGDRASMGLRDLADRLAAAPRPEEVPPLAARAVGQALDLRGTAVDVRTPEGSRRLAAWGDTSGASVVRPLQHAGVEVGSLVLVLHRDGVPVDLAALDGIVPPVAAVVAATQLTQDLAAARDRVLQVREEERARLRADLHDELSPSLAGTRLTIAAATDRLPARDADDARRLLKQADSELGHAGSVVRNILEDLRPDSLTHHDLLGAVQTRAASFDKPGEFAVPVQADAPLPSLDPQVEAAVFRIASEAMSNAARHSHGSRAVVRLAAQDGGLQLTVSDDGIGLPALPREGVGLGSMADRAAAVGGHLQVSAPASGGTLVTGWFPAAVQTQDTP